MDTIVILLLALLVFTLIDILAVIFVLKLIMSAFGNASKKALTGLLSFISKLK